MRVLALIAVGLAACGAPVSMGPQPGDRCGEVSSQCLSATHGLYCDSTFDVLIDARCKTTCDAGRCDALAPQDGDACPQVLSGSFACGTSDYLKCTDRKWQTVMSCPKCRVEGSDISCN